ncbi:MAG: ABC transporter ATP-binding protein, partial [Candidatus Magasanikbacteria bacterium]|nr:ABC transporter ATP-binding protein [Candidatus Magasanikbacteria bacterium]
SGCGKSTLLRSMSGLDTASHGTVQLAHTISSNDMSFVFQQFALLPWLTVEENIGMGLVAREELSDVVKYSRVERELTRFHLEKFRKSFPRELSGGMKQRVGIARALATDPKIIFMDEPFSALDSFTAEELRGELLEIWSERRPTIVMVTHNIPEALELGDRIAIMTPRPGQLERMIHNELPRPRAVRSPEFFALQDEIQKLIRL